MIGVLNMDGLISRIRTREVLVKSLVHVKVENTLFKLHSISIVEGTIVEYRYSEIISYCSKEYLYERRKSQTKSSFSTAFLSVSFFILALCELTKIIDSYSRSELI